MHNKVILIHANLRRLNGVASVYYTSIRRQQCNKKFSFK